MSDPNKFPFDAVPLDGPVGGTAVADPPRPSFSRSATDTAGLLPPSRKPVAVTVPEPAPTPPAESPNPMAGSPPPKAGSLGGLVWDLVRPTRTKWAILAGGVSLVAGAYGLNLVAPNPIQTTRTQLPDAPKPEGPNPQVVAERQPPPGVDEQRVRTPVVVKTVESAPFVPAASAPLPVPQPGKPLPLVSASATLPADQTPSPAPLPLPLPAPAKPEVKVGQSDPLPVPPPLEEKPKAGPLPLVETKTPDVPTPLPAPTLPPVGGTPTPAAVPAPPTLPPAGERPDPLPPVSPSELVKPVPPKPETSPFVTVSDTTPKGDAIPPVKDDPPPLPLPVNPKPAAPPLPAPVETKPTTLPVPTPVETKPAPLPAPSSEIKFAPPGGANAVPAPSTALPPIGDTVGRPKDEKPTPLPAPAVPVTPEPVAKSPFVEEKSPPVSSMPVLNEPPAVVAGGGPPPKKGFEVDVVRVRSTDTYASISEAFYQSRKYAGALRAFNGDADISRLQEVEVPPLFELQKQPAPKTREADPITPTRGAADPAVRGPVFDPPVGGEPVDWGPAGKKRPVTKYEKYTTPKEGMTARDVARAVYADENEWAKLIGPRGARLRADDPLPRGTELTVPREEVVWK